jgi:hypothetical protein
VYRYLALTDQEAVAAMSHGQRLLRYLVRHLIELAGHTEILAELKVAFMALHPRPHLSRPRTECRDRASAARDAPVRTTRREIGSTGAVLAQAVLQNVPRTYSERYPR